LRKVEKIILIKVYCYLLRNVLGVAALMSKRIKYELGSQRNY
jgi:hypothetical protein